MAITRRGFLKGTLMGSAAAVSTSSVANATELFSPIEKIPHACHIGAFYAHLQDGKIIDISAQESDKHPTHLITSVIDRTYSQSRINYPYIRKGYLEGSVNHKKLRGNDEFVRVSWDEVSTLIATKLKSTLNENIYNASYGGWAHPGRLNRCNVLSGKFFNSFGGAISTAGEYSNGAALTVNPGIVGDLEVYSLQTAHEQIIENTKVYVMWGADLFKTNKIDFAVANRKNDEYYIKYKKAGIKFISIDPINTESAKMFDAEWIKIRPNTDVALMLGMMYYLYQTNTYDKAFIEKYTYGFDKFLPYLLGKTDGIKKTPEWASEITKVEAKKIEELAALFVNERTFLAGNWAMQRAHHGEQADWALITLASMIGQIGLPGGGFGFSMHYAGGGQANSGKKIVPGLSMGRNPIKSIIPASRISEAILNPGKKSSYKGEEITFPKISLLYVAGSNIIGHHPDTNEIIKALKTLDTIIVQEPWWTPTAKYADIVLPASTTLERDDITFGGSYSQDYVYAMKKVINNPFEAKADYDIFAMIAQKISSDAYSSFTEGKDTMTWIKELYAKSSGVESKTFEQFWEDGFVKFDIPEKSYSFVRHASFREDPEKNKLKTETGKIQIFSDKFASFNYSDFKGHPIWMEPAEYLGSKEVAQFPLHLLSPHPTYRVHSQLDNVWLTKLYKVQDREPVRINPKDAQKYGINDGDIVELFNNRGRILAGAVVTSDISEGVVAIEEGAWYSPEFAEVNKSRCNSGHVNVLTSSRPTSQMAQATSVNTTLVGIKKATGPITPNLAYNPPKLRN